MRGAMTVESQRRLNQTTVFANVPTHHSAATPTAHKREHECLCYSIVMQDMFDVMVLPLISEEFSILVGCRVLELGMLAS